MSEHRDEVIRDEESPGPLDRLRRVFSGEPADTTADRHDPDSSVDTATMADRPPTVGEAAFGTDRDARSAAFDGTPPAPVPGAGGAPAFGDPTPDDRPGPHDGSGPDDRLDLNDSPGPDDRLDPDDGLGSDDGLGADDRLGSDDADDRPGSDDRLGSDDADGRPGSDDRLGSDDADDRLVADDRLETDDRPGADGGFGTDDRLSADDRPGADGGFGADDRLGADDVPGSGDRLDADDRPGADGGFGADDRLGADDRPDPVDGPDGRSGADVGPGSGEPFSPAVAPPGAAGGLPPAGSDDLGAAGAVPPAEADDRLLPPPGGGAAATQVGTPPPAPAVVGGLPADHSDTDGDAVPDREAGPDLGSDVGPGEETVSTSEAGALLASEQVARFRERWLEVQTGFVDSPRDTVQQADQLTGELMDHLAQTFTEERHRLEQQWDGGDVATDDLRAAFQRYRSFFDRLLAT